MDENLKRILSEVFEIKEIELDDNMTKDDIDNWDSLTQLDLVVSLENFYEIELEMEEIVNMKNIKAIAEIVTSKIGNQ